MKILYLGDVMAGPGLGIIERELPNLRKELAADVVIAQAENLTFGKGIALDDFAQIQSAGVDFCTGGNHTLFRPEIYPQLSDPDEPIIRPANYPSGTAGLGYKYLSTPAGDILVISLLGQIVGKDANVPVDNPLHVIDRILAEEAKTARVATVVNFHGDFSSEKVIIGQYIDGRVTMVVGDHWHVPTADARVLPMGTAHMTDVGMCGVLNSSLGISMDSVVGRWRDGKHTRNVIEEAGPLQINGLLVTVNSQGLVDSCQAIRRIYKK